MDKEPFNEMVENEPDDALEARLDAQADADYAAGRVVPHERVREWLTKLSKGENVPPPAARRGRASGRKAARSRKQP